MTQTTQMTHFFIVFSYSHFCVVSIIFTDAYNCYCIDKLLFFHTKLTIFVG